MLFRSSRNIYNLNNSKFDMITKSKLREIIKIQNEEVSNPRDLIEREELDRIKISRSFAIIISGVRRCGKSTLLVELMKKERKVYI